MNIRISIANGGFALPIAERPVRTFLANLPLANCCAASLSGMYLPWLCKETKLLLTKASQLAVDVNMGDDEFTIQDLLQVSSSGDVPFPALRVLVIQHMDLEHFAASAVHTMLRSRPLPIEDMMIKFRRCRNVNRRKIDRLRQFMPVLWDGRGEVDCDRDSNEEVDCDRDSNEDSDDTR